MFSLPQPMTPRFVGSTRSGKARVSLLALLGGTLCVAAALGLVVWLVIKLGGGGGGGGGGGDVIPPVYVTFKVRWEDTKFVNEAKESERRGRVAFQDAGFAYVEASKVDLDLERIEREIGDPVELPGSLVGGLASYKISFVSSTCGGSSDDCQRIVDVGDETFFLRFPRGSLKLDGVSEYASGAGSSLEGADPAGIVELSKRY